MAKRNRLRRKAELLTRHSCPRTSSRDRWNAEILPYDDHLAPGGGVMEMLSEMAQEAREENFFLFGFIAEQVAGSRGWYNPQWHYEHEPETRAAST